MSYLVGLDLAVLRAVNGLAGWSWTLDQVILLIRVNPVVKGVVPMMILWGL